VIVFFQLLCVYVGGTLSNLKIIFILVCTLGITACSGGNSSSKGLPAEITANDANDLRGLWLEKKDAEELRSTGKLVSMCDEIKNHGGIVSNALRIEDSGRVTLYTESPQSRGSVLVGNFNLSLKILTLSDDYAKDFGTKSLQGTVVNGVLSFSKPENNLFVFVKSTPPELDSYYKAQRDCLQYR
jgi:hypothetical protein